MLALSSSAATSFVPQFARTNTITMAADSFDPAAFAKGLPGATAPLGFFDPLGFCGGEASESRVRFLREAEVKHGRVAMLAALGFLVGENFHPLFGGEINVPSYVAFQATPLQDYWKWVVAVIGLIEIGSVNTLYFPLAIQWRDGKRNVFFRPWQTRESHSPGDLGFDPLGWKPAEAEDLKMMQAKELNNGRAAMVGIAGMVAQELVSGGKLF